MLFQINHTLRMILWNESTTSKFLVYISMKLLQGKHIDKITKKISPAISAIRRLKDFARNISVCEECFASPWLLLRSLKITWDGLARDFRGSRILLGVLGWLWIAETNLANQKFAMQALGWITLSRRKSWTQIKAKVIFRILRGLAIATQPMVKLQS